MTYPSAPPAPAGREPAADAGGPPRRIARADPTKDALFDSRHRWRELVLLGADLAFETDSRGHFSLLAPDTVLGWPADQLLGRPASLLLGEEPAGRGFNPFRPLLPARGRRAWLKRADGTDACLSFSVAPVRDGRGRLLGGRGVATDMTEQDDSDDASAAALRRCGVIDHILWRMRQEVMAPRMMQAALQALSGALGAEGAGVLQPAGDGGATLLHVVGTPLDGLAAAAAGLLPAAPERAERSGADAAWSAQAEAAVRGIGPDGRRLLVCGCETRFGQRSALLLWRRPDGRDWDADDLMLVTSASGIARVILEHDSIQQEMARQARTDPLTGLLNRRAFFEEVTRHADRLDGDNQPGTLMFIDLDHFKRVNDVLGHDVGDQALCILADLLRAAVRPADLVARLGGDEFAVWLDGMEELSASERAEMLRLEAPGATAHLISRASAQNPVPPVTLSIGIATRWPGHNESLDSVVQRADQVMYDVKHAGRAHWRVSRVDAW